jgi:chemotaxis response regulator CheB
MISKTIRVLVVDANPSGEEDLHSQLDAVPGVEIVGAAHSQRAMDRKRSSTNCRVGN